MVREYAQPRVCTAAIHIPRTDARAADSLAALGDLKQTESLFADKREPFSNDIDPTAAIPLCATLARGSGCNSES